MIILLFIYLTTPNIESRQGEMKEKPLSDHVSYSWYMPRFFNSEYQYWRIVQAQKKEKLSWLLKNFVSDCWRVVWENVEQMYQQLSKNRTSDCWTVVPVTVDEPYPVTVELLCQRLLNNHTKNCWTIVPATAEQLCHPAKLANKALFLRLVAI